MVIFTRLLLLTLHLLSHVYANEEPTSEAVKWLEAERSVLVHLATPDLFFLNQRDQISTQTSGAFIFNFTLAPDNRTLFLNGEPILPRAYPHIPTPLRAYQTGQTTTDFAHQVSTDFTEGPVMDLDYYINAPDATSGTSIYNTRYNPRLQIDILRAHMPTSPGHSTPLSSNSQDQIWVWLEDLSVHPPETLYSSIALRIKRVKVDRRWPDYDSQGTATYRTPKSLKPCHIWSWLCADIDQYPYYEYIYQENFDQYGKKGSMRHFLTKRWANLVELIGFQLAIAWLAMCLNMALLSSVYAVCRGVKSVIEVYQRRMKEVDEWVADEEVSDEGFEGLLQNNEHLEDFGELESEELAKGKIGEKTSVDESLHRVRI